MERPETPKPKQPELLMCINPAYYEIFATTEERLAYYARLEKERHDKRYRELLKELDLIEDENYFH